MGLKLRANLFPGGDANFRQAMYQSQERSLQAPRDEFDLYGTQASFVLPRVDLPRSLRRIDFFGLYPSSLSESARFVSLAGKASLVSLSDAVPFLRP